MTLCKEWFTANQCCISKQFRKSHNSHFIYIFSKHIEYEQMLLKKYEEKRYLHFGLFLLWPLPFRKNG